MCAAAYSCDQRMPGARCTHRGHQRHGPEPAQRMHFADAPSRDEIVVLVLVSATSTASPVLADPPMRAHLVCYPRAHGSPRRPRAPTRRLLIRGPSLRVARLGAPGVRTLGYSLAVERELRRDARRGRSERAKPRAALGGRTRREFGRRQMRIGLEESAPGSRAEVKAEGSDAGWMSPPRRRRESIRSAARSPVESNREDVRMRSRRRRRLGHARAERR